MGERDTLLGRARAFIGYGCAFLSGVLLRASDIPQDVGGGVSFGAIAVIWVIVNRPRRVKPS